MLELTAAQEGCGFDSQDKAFLSGVLLFFSPGTHIQLPSTVSRHALQTCVCEYARCVVGPDIN